MNLSIVTVVYNDLTGLMKTVESVNKILRSGDVEYWIIDGDSKDGTINYLEQLSDCGVKWISEPDNGLYDAMNKSLDYISGDYVLFLNAGDLLDQEFSLTNFLQYDKSKSKILMGYSIERYGCDAYLRPGLGNEESVFSSPPHQATFYTSTFYRYERYKLDLRKGADSNYTYRGIQKCGVIFIPNIICEFQLGGLSTNYSNLKSIIYSFNEARKVKPQMKLFLKIVLWHILPKRVFYRVLAFRKYTRITSKENISLSNTIIEKSPASK